ncbi:hypothetical protein EST38_g5350 [Candolleomyces aberdarensis]|uniref:F-box domain-containing protein n=1 Tax=Candolleomyces aberdarensis TaxID=2316362 RepID=A0A4V1Q414_9AGAR|nr:hypothetical protein EST38_g5350 [Candolleomyces aberdarensis]
MPRLPVEHRLHELGLPDEIVSIAQSHRDLPPRGRSRVELAITEYEEEISSLHTRIANLELPKEWYTRQELYQDVWDVDRKLQACRSLLSVMRRIPFETMAEIFEYYLAPGGKGRSIMKEKDDEEGDDEDEDDEDEDDEDGPGRTPSPGLLCRVCRYWKAVATTTPSLWSNIHIRAQEQKVGGYPLVKSTHVRGILSWMDRVTSHPWSLTVQATRHRGAFARDGSAVPLSQLLNRPASLHLRRLQIDANQFSVGLGQITFPRVTSVVVDCDHGDDRDDPQLPDLPSMPALTKAVLCCVLRTSYILPHIPWSQLTHLFLGRAVEIPQWRAIFKLCTALQQGCFHIMDVHPDSDIMYSEPAQVTLPDLTDLTFLYMSPFMEPLNGVSLPSLSKLQLFTGWAEPSWDFLNPDLFQNLTHLSLVNCSWAEHDTLIPILKTVPQLAELFFSLTIGFEVVFNFLAFGHEGKFNLRSLRALGIHMDMERVLEPVDGEGGRGTEAEESADESTPFPFQALTNFISSRTQAVQRGDFANRPHSLTLLQKLVLRVDTADWADKMVLKLREEVVPYDKYGLRTLVFGPQDNTSTWGTDFTHWLMQHRHWDEGFIDIIRGVEQYSLYPGDPKDPLSE